MLLSVFGLFIFTSWGFYVYFHKFGSIVSGTHSSPQPLISMDTIDILQKTETLQNALILKPDISKKTGTPPKALISKPVESLVTKATTVEKHKSKHDIDIEKLRLLDNNHYVPVMGSISTNGTKPIFGSHTGRDAIFALACNYKKDLYQYFVGSLRKFGYNDDIVLAVSPQEKMHAGVEKYVREMNVVAYAFEVDCKGKDQCKLKDEFLG